MHEGISGGDRNRAERQRLQRINAEQRRTVHMLLDRFGTSVAKVLDTYGLTPGARSRALDRVSRRMGKMYSDREYTMERFTDARVAQDFLKEAIDREFPF